MSEPSDAARGAAERAADLELVRLGEQFFANAVSELDDAALDAPSLLPDWTRAHVAGHVGLNARALTRLVGWAATGVEHRMYPSRDARNADIEAATGLTSHQIVQQATESAALLDAAWRSLPDDRWSFPVVVGNERTIPVSETIWMRAREVWMHALDLDHGASIDDFPPAIIDRLLADLVSVWGLVADPPSIVLEPDDRSTTWVVAGAIAPDLRVRGTAVDLVRWGTGRGSGGVTTPDGIAASPAPTWL